MGWAEMMSARSFRPQRRLYSSGESGLGVEVAYGEVEGCAFAGFTFGPYASSVAVDDALHGGEADAGAGEITLCVEPLEGFE